MEFTALLAGFTHVLARIKKGQEKQIPVQFSRRLLDIAERDAEAVLRAFDSSAAGLSTAEAEARLAAHGPNEVAQEKQATWYSQLFHSFNHPFNLLLLVLAGLSFVLGDIDAALIIAVMVGLSVLLRFFQEYRSNVAAEKLKAMVSTTVTVIRRDADGEGAETEAARQSVGPGRREIPLNALVPGDMVFLSAGDMVPADVRLITAKDLFVSQATLTGEALPVEKITTSSAEMKLGSALEAPNLAFMGTNVVSGAATALVVATGAETFFGTLAKTVVQQRVLTNFDKGVNGVSWLLIRFMLVMVPLVFLINGITKHDWWEALLFALSVAVGLTPEMLPMIVTSTLARGAVAMSRKKVIVKQLNAIQNFGAMDVLCTDKTGTLTQDHIILEKHVDVHGEESATVIKYAYLNSYYQTGLKNLLDVAILEHAEMHDALRVESRYRKIDEIPFDFVRRRMSVVVQESAARNLVICKGAVEEIFAVSSRALVADAIVPLDDVLRAEIREVTRDLNEDGFRVIAVAYKETPAAERPYTVQDEAELILVGYIAFLDPPKDSAAPAIAALNAHGVNVKILTGDNEIVTRKVCKEVGLPVSRIALGAEIESLDEAALGDLVERTTVFAKLTPAHKERIVTALRAKGHVVGFMGDGINDAPALRAADIGVSVDSAVDIAKESADIILLEKSLMVLEEGVLEGRKTFGNIVKYIRMAASSNFGNMFSVLGASALLPFLPMLPVQILIQNLLYDFSQTAIPFDNVDADYLERPRTWEIGNLARFMVVMGPISSLFDYATFALMWFVFQANTAAAQSLFQSGWFVEGLLSQTLIVHMIRTGKLPFVQSHPSGALLATTALVMAIGIYVPFSGLGSVLGLTPLPGSYFLWLIAFLLSYALLTQVVKFWFMRRYGYD